MFIYIRLAIKFIKFEKHNPEETRILENLKKDQVKNKYLLYSEEIIYFQGHICILIPFYQVNLNIYI